MISIPSFHPCDLERGSNSCLPKLPPKSGIIPRLVRAFHKSTIVTRENPRTKEFLRSQAAIIAERKRHIRSNRRYIIHPLSKFSKYREILLSVVWIIAFICDPFTLAFHTTSDGVKVSHSVNALNIFVELILYVHMILSLFTGYAIPKTKEIVLDFKQIIYHYLGTYFLIDFIGTLPCGYTYDFLFPVKNRILSIGLGCLHMVRCMRVVTMLQYFRQVTLLFKIGDTLHECICIIIGSILFTHWVACFVFFIPRMHFMVYGYVPSDTWIVSAGIAPGKHTPVAEKYAKSMIISLSHFFSAGADPTATKNLTEYYLFSLAYIGGSFYMAYIVIMIFEIVRSTSSSENKYDEIVTQLKEFMRSKKLPVHLQEKLLAYYKNRFQQRYFREETILSTLSDHLKHEIFLFACRTLLDKAKIFEGMGRETIGSIVGCLKQEVYLPNDVIFKHGYPATAVYFISFGLVVEYLPNGTEVQHFEDGDNFGETPLVMKFLNQTRQHSVIASEITEIFRLDKKDLWNHMSLHEDFAKAMIKSAEQKYKDSIHFSHSGGSEPLHMDVLHDLRSGKILNQGRRRQTFSSS